eukprot:5996382-Lingulodinium_polyedra.AAC.1
MIWPTSLAFFGAFGRMSRLIFHGILLDRERAVLPVELPPREQTVAFWHGPTTRSRFALNLGRHE